MRRANLLTQVLIVNLLLIGAAAVGAILASNPRYELSDTPATALVVGLAVALTVSFNVYLLQRRFRPLERLVDEMERADLSRPGANLQPDEAIAGPEEVERLHRAFRVMVERLDAERRRTSSAALAAQEEERARVARDLHDEVNQSLTGLLLRLEALRSNAPARARRRARRDQGAGQPGDARAVAPGPPAAARRRSTTSASRPQSPGSSRISTCARG